MANKILFQTSLVDTDTADVEGVSIIREDSDGRKYRWIKNRNATALLAKQVVCYDAGNVGTVALFKSINAPVTADLMLQAGITMTAIGASGASCFGWIQVEGYCADTKCITTSGTVTAIGDELVAANGASTLIRATAVGTAPKRMFTFQALEAMSGTGSAAATKDVYIKCL